MTKEEEEFFAKYGLGKGATGTGMPTPAMQSVRNFGTRRDIVKAYNRSQDIDYLDRNTAPDGVRFDPYRGLSGTLRAQASFERDPQKRAAWYAKQPGIMGVRFDDKGRLIVRTTDESGDPIDHLEDEAKWTTKDMADMASAAPVVAAQVGTAAATGGMSLIPQAVAVGAAGAATTAASDVLARRSMGTGQDMGDTATNAGIGFALDVGIPLVPAGIKRGVQRVIGGSGFASDFERKTLREAAARIKARTGITVDLTPAQKTGSPVMAQLESFAQSMETVPLVGDRLRQKVLKQDEQMRAVQRHILGLDKSPIPTGEDLTLGVGKELQGQRDVVDATIGGLKQSAGQGAASDLASDIANVSNPNINLTATEAGAGVRGKIVALRDQFKAQNKANYDAVYNHTGASLPIFDTGGVKAALAEIEGEQIKDAKGKAIDSLISPDLKKFLGLGGKLPDKMRLQDVINMRTQVNDLIENSAALPGVPQRHLKKISAALTDTIESGVDALPDTGFKDALKKASGYYKAEFSKFNEPGISELFAAPKDGSGFVPDEAIVDRVFNGKGSYDLLSRYKRVLGDASPEYKALLRAGYNQLLGSAERRVGGFIDAGSFLQRLDSLRPEVQRELLGPHAKTIAQNAELLRAVQGQKIDPGALEYVLAGTPSSAAARLKQAVELEKVRDEFYGQEVVKGFLNGLVDASKIDADEFVARFVDRASTGQIKEVFKRLSGNPQLVEDIKRKTIQDTLHRATRAFNATDVAEGIAGRAEVPVDAAALFKLTRGDKGEKLRAIIGNDAMESMTDYLTMETARLKKDQIGKQSGQLVSAGLRAAIFKGQIKELPTIARYKTLSVLMSTPGISQWVSPKTVVDNPKLRQAVFSSPAFVRALVSEFQDEPELLGQVSEVLRRDANEDQESEDFLKKYAPPR